MVGTLQLIYSNFCCPLKVWGIKERHGKALVNIRGTLGDIGEL
jgi:hypothetical protein